MSADPHNPYNQASGGQHHQSPESPHTPPPGNEDWTRREYDWDRGGYSAPSSGSPYGAPHQGQQYGSQYGQPFGWQPHPEGEPWIGQSRDMSPGDEKTWAVLAHVAAPVATLLSAGWLGFVAPLVIWLVYRDRSAFVRAAAARSFNFNLLLFLGNALAYLLLFTIILIPVAILLWIAMFIAMLVFHISAAMDASKGILYRYPISLPVLS